MNKDRRKAIDVLKARIEAMAMDAQGLVEEIQAILDEEQECYDNMPESLQGSDRGTAADEAIGHLQNAAETLDSFNFDEIVIALESAAD